MSVFNITLERTVTTRETGQVTVDAADLGEAERIARSQVRNGTALDVDWQSDISDASRVVVVDVEEVDGAGEWAA
ncbi:hypothetical protein FO470_13105 [Starkeya sp. 3C]|uniref:Uncharacterized protein n=1 Tax=Ancylobacter moscoviensis TaxID=2597768 RepID=A0ABY3DPB7_9HYPH|nr:hypothetical protein [Ancylobacter moscoviensis]TSJ61424.1 hypothetical protein FO470_13105 [Ancylobacter moscoviensis]